MRTGMAPREQEDMSQSILIETVRVVRDFLQSKVSECNTWDDAEKVYELKHLFELTKNPQASFAQVKGQGVGIRTITDFLGGGWKQWKIQSALDTLNAEDINMDAMFEFMLYKLKLNEPQTAHNELNKACIED